MQSFLSELSSTFMLLQAIIVNVYLRIINTRNMKKNILKTYYYTKEFFYFSAVKIFFEENVLKMQVLIFFGGTNMNWTAKPLIFKK